MDRLLGGFYSFDYFIWNDAIEALSNLAPVVDGIDECNPVFVEALVQLPFGGLVAEGVSDGVQADQLEVFEAEAEGVRGHEKVGRDAAVAEFAGVVGADADGDAQIVEGDGRVLGQVVDVAQKLVGNGAHLHADLPGRNRRNEVRVLSYKQVVPETGSARGLS